MTAESTENTLAGQLWSDEPAKVDLLAANAIAATVADAVLDDALDPLSLGLSGPWGSGKTTVLELVDAELEGRSTDNSKVVVVRTDPWRYDPSVGAKESIIADVLNKLEEELEQVDGEVKTAAKSALRSLSERVNWSKALKLAAKTGLALQLPRLEDLTELIEEPSDDEEKPGEPRGLAGFREEFESLMASDGLSHVRRVAVLVDDLDRCLSNTVVESLEAIRLFLSVPKMAFIIAADEDRVADAIKAELPAWEMPKERPGGADALPPEPPWKLYLHKIVQTTVPLPALGAYDTEAYLLLLQVQNRTAITFTDAQLEELISTCGDLRGVGTLDELKPPAGTDVQAELAFAHRMTAILYQKLAGNPRRIKRFLNDMNVRRSIAARRGIKLDYDVVAKLMVLEVLLPTQFKEVLNWLRGGELRDRLTVLERLANNAGDKEPAERVDEESAADPGNKGTAAKTKKGAGKATPVGPESEEANDGEPSDEAPETAVSGTDPGFDDDLLRWAKLDPLLAEIDLSPYLHLAASFSGDLLVSDELPQRLRDLALQLTTIGPIGRKAADELATRITVEDASILVRYFSRRARDREQEQRGAVAAIGRLAGAHAALIPAALDGLRRLPPDQLSVPTAIHIAGLKLDGIESVHSDLRARTEGQVKNALTKPTTGGA
jgi:hypothetical protein